MVSAKLPGSQTDIFCLLKRTYIFFHFRMEFFIGRLFRTSSIKVFAGNLNAASFSIDSGVPNFMRRG